MDLDTFHQPAPAITRPPTIKHRKVVLIFSNLIEKM